MTAPLDAETIAGLMPLVRQLADGQVHSGGDLGELLGVSRTAVWKQLKKLESLGLMVEATKGAGYKLVAPVDLLEPQRVNHFTELFTSGRARLEILPAVDSTNSRVASLLLQPENTAFYQQGGLVVCSAELQTAGRGRRGRSWQSPFASNLYFSLGTQVDGGIGAYEGLSLAVGVVIVEVLQSLGAQGLSLKWPNDILHNGSKLAGILIEIGGDFAGVCSLVVGVGVNCQMPSAVGNNIDQSWSDLRAATEGENNWTRSELLAKLSQALAELINTYAQVGFSGYRQRWLQWDACLHQPVVVKTVRDQQSGLCLGVDDNGALLMEVNGQTQTFSGGEVSLRLTE